MARLALSLFLASTALAADLPKSVPNSIGMAMIPIPAGTFMMGTPSDPPKNRLEWMARDEDESPAHEVSVSAFTMSAFEVTNKQFEALIPEHKAWRDKHGGTKGDNEPVVFVTHADAVTFCELLSKKEGKPYRLPTEAEWEYACRAGTNTAFHTGSELRWDDANTGRDADDRKRSGAMNVGSYKPNAFGLFDMHGNIAEWCHDWYGSYSAEKQIDPVGRATGYARVVRGWSWLNTGSQSITRFARSANRSGLLPDDANRYTGFRVVRGELLKSKPLPVEPPLNAKDVKQTPAPKTGPDPAKPYFVNFADGGKNPKMPADSWGPIFSNHNHFSACCACPNGDVLAVWYTCVGERDRQLAQAASRLRAGSDKWDEPSLFFGVPDVNCHAPVLLRDGSRIYHFCTQSLHGWDYASNIMRYSDDSGATWSQPVVILPRDNKDALSQPCSALVAKDGALVLACDGDEHKDEKAMISKDKGKTWTVAKADMRKAAGGKYVIHPAIAERDDGAILNFLRGQDPMPLLVSKDRGDSWDVFASPFGGINSGNKSAALTLKSGAILMLTQDSKKQLGGGSLVALSLDGGKTWPHARKVDAAVQGYMSACQTDDGTIYLIGSRTQFAACNEAWVKEGKPMPERK